MEEKKMSRTAWRADILVPAFIALGLALLLNDSYHAPPRPMLLPRAVQVMTFGFCIILAVKNYLKAKPVPVKDPAKAREKIKLLITFAGILTFPFWTYLLGFLLTSVILVFCVFMAWSTRRRVWRHLIIGEAIIVFLLWGVMIWFFRFEYPRGILGKAIFG